MTDKNKNLHDTNDDFDLSNMINEYEEDSELRKKIEQMKKEKQEQPVSDVFQSSQEPVITNGERKQGPFLDVDETQSDIGATRIMNVEDEGDKTLVIMNHQQKREFAQVGQEDTDESIYEYNSHDIEEELTDDDIRDYLGDEEEPKMEEPHKKDPNKMNKIVTSVIIGIVALCVLVALGFGFKALMDNYEGNKKPPVVEGTDKNDKGEKDNGEDKKPVNNEGEDEKEGNENDKPNDNSVRIAEINGSIKDKQKRIEDLNAQLEKVKADKANAEANFKQTTYDELKNNRDNTLRLMSDKQTELEACEASGEEGKDCSQLKNEFQELANAIDGYEKQIKTMEGYKATIDNAPNEITEINNTITNLNNEVLKLQNELAGLQ